MTGGFRVELVCRVLASRSDASAARAREYARSYGLVQPLSLDSFVVNSAHEPVPKHLMQVVAIDALKSEFPESGSVRI